MKKWSECGSVPRKSVGSAGVLKACKMTYAHFSKFVTCHLMFKGYVLQRPLMHEQLWEVCHRGALSSVAGISSELASDASSLGLCICSASCLGPGCQCCCWLDSVDGCIWGEQGPCWVYASHPYNSIAVVYVVCIEECNTHLKALKKKTNLVMKYLACPKSTALLLVEQLQEASLCFHGG